MIHQVHSVGFTVADLARVLPFYTDVLAFNVIEDVEVWGEPYERLTGIFGARLRVVTLQLGEERIQLTQYLAPAGGRPVPADSRSNDLWFQHIAIVVSDIDAAYDRLRQQRVQHVSTAPQTLPASIPAAAGIRAFYFRDPDGHDLELIAFPPGKGQARWQSQASVFLGIDHTAIAVGDTARSQQVYQALGFERVGESVNAGTEQEHLNGVFGCQVQITGWRPRADAHGHTIVQDGIGVEFLEYLTPPGGRPMPADTRANDLWYREITLISTDLDADFAAVHAALGQRQSAQIVTLPPSNPLGYTRAFTLRDADGHALKVIEG